MTSSVSAPAHACTGLDRALPAKTRLEGSDYEIEAVVALSSVAVVYRAYDHAFDRVVAIKEYLPQGLTLRGSGDRVAPRWDTCRSRFEIGRSAFIDESLSLARFEHPSLLRVLGLLQANGTVYRVMRFTPGPTLLDHRRRLGGMPAPEDYLLWGNGLVSALALLHSQGLMHGAVTPSNILLRPGECPLLLGFGAVREALGDVDAPNLTGATPSRFVAPEKRRAMPRSAWGPWTDLYGLAASLHYGLSGEVASVSEHDPATPAFEPMTDAWRRLQGGVPPPADLARLFDAIDTCLAEEPGHRLQSVADFVRHVAGEGGVTLTAVRSAARPGAGHADTGRAGSGCAVDASVAADADAVDSAYAATEDVAPAESSTLSLDEAAARPPQAEDLRELLQGPARAPQGRKWPVDEAPAAPALEPPTSVERTPSDTSAADAAIGAGAAVDVEVVEHVGATWCDADVEQSAAAPALPPAQGLAEPIESVGPGTAAATAEGSPQPSVQQPPVDRRGAGNGATLRVVVGVAVVSAVLWFGLGPGESDRRPEPPPAPVRDALAPASSAVIDATPARQPTRARPDTGAPAPVVEQARGVAPTPRPPAPTAKPSDSPATVRSPAAKPLPVPAKPRPSPKVPTAATSPEQICHGRTGFALYRCMQAQCANAQWLEHAQCLRLHQSNAAR